MAGIVLGLGNGCLDTVLRLERMPEAGGKLAVLERYTAVGGQIAGALAGCARLGLGARMVLRTGDDAAGETVRAALAAEGVDLAWSRTCRGAGTAAATILRDRSGERAVLWETPPGLALRADEVVPEMFDGAGALLLDGRDGEASLAAARLARERGLAVIADFDHVYPHTARLLEWVNHLVVPAAFPLAASAPCDVVVVTQGGAGCEGWERGHAAIRVPAFAVEVVDTTGAGDAFHAGYIYAWLEGRPLRRRLQFANACAALACTAPGTLTALPRRAAVEQLLLQRGAA